MKYGTPSVDKVFDNTIHKTPIQLYTYNNIAIFYDPIIKQVYLHNHENSHYYYDIQYTYEGNTSKLGYISPFASSGSLILNVGEKMYMTPSGQLDDDYNIDTNNDKLLWKDCTIKETGGDGSCFRCDMNNQHMSPSEQYPNSNAILMSTLLSPAPS